MWPHPAPIEFSKTLSLTSVGAGSVPLCERCYSEEGFKAW